MIREAARQGDHRKSPAGLIACRGLLYALGGVKLCRDCPRCPVWVWCGCGQNMPAWASVRPVAGFFVRSDISVLSRPPAPVLGRFWGFCEGIRKPRRACACPGLRSLPEGQPWAAVLLPVGDKLRRLCLWYHGDIVEGQPVRGHVVPPPVTG